MLVKAGRTKDLASYSLGNIVLANIGNLIYAMYVLSLPFGPVWGPTWIPSRPNRTHAVLVSATLIGVDREQTHQPPDATRGESSTSAA